jgi:tRNA dimethylallyltransferase
MSDAKGSKVHKKWLIVLPGPTGIGKTQLAVELAQAIPTEILSADSRQFYREMKIGTACPSPEQLYAVRHHLIGNISIHDYYNVSMFEIDALAILEKLFQTYSKVILTGGSGLYIDAICHGIDDLPSADQDIRKQLQQEYKNKGLEWLRQELLRLDPEHYNKVDIHNPKRILKALEVCYLTGKPYSSFLTQPKKKRDFSILKIGLNMDRELLYERINLRVDRMMQDGLAEEARSLLPFRNLNALNTVGYKELFDYFNEKISLEKAVELIKRNSRHYAKRQLTWFARDKEIRWFSPDEKEQILHLIHTLS